MIQRISRPGQPPTTIDFGPGPVGDDDVRALRYLREATSYSATPIGKMVPNKAIFGLNVLRVQQAARRRARQANR